MSDQFSISFEGDAYQTFQRLIAECKGYGVTVTTLDGEVVDGVLRGPNLEGEWGDEILIHQVENENYEVLSSYNAADARRVRIGDVHIH